jgi:hypothetical protein
MTVPTSCGRAKINNRKGANGPMLREKTHSQHCEGAVLPKGHANYQEKRQTRSAGEQHPAGENERITAPTAIVQRGGCTHGRAVSPQEPALVARMGQVSAQNRAGGRGAAAMRAGRFAARRHDQPGVRGRVDHRECEAVVPNALR